MMDNRPDDPTMEQWRNGRKNRVNRFLDLTLVWVLPYIIAGYSRPLDEEDIPVNNGTDRTSELAGLAKLTWEKEVKKNGAKASMFKVFFKLQWFELCLGISLSFVQGVLFSVARPLLLGEIITIVSDPASTTKEGIVVAVIFALVILVEGIVQAQVKQTLSTRLGTRFMSWSTSLLHEKATTVSETAVSVAGFQETSLIGSDVTRMVEDWRWVCLLPYVCVALVGGVTILALTLGLSALVGFAIMFSIAYINYRITHMIKRVEEEDFAMGDKRIGILREILAGIKAIKMMAWEYPFRNLLDTVRNQEADLIQKFRTYSVSSINLGRASPVLSSAFSILTLALTDPDNLNARTIFVAISAFQGLRLPLIALPQQSAMLMNSIVSFKRLNRYLVLDDAPPPDQLDSTCEDSVQIDNATFGWTLNHSTLATVEEKGKEEEVDQKSTKSAAVVAVENKEKEQDQDPENGPVVYDSISRFSLRDINICVKRNNDLVAVVGKVAAGKSSLCSAVLGSMFVEQGSVRTVDRIAYVPQKAFVMSGTILENILMDNPLDDNRLERALNDSSFKVDLKQLPDGIMTEIGERGQTLSGGQAQRLSIARALYHDPELLIMDDPLSAVDPEVSNNLFRDAVLGFLGRRKGEKRKTNRSVLMCLNQLHLLHYFDRIVVLDSGKIVEDGTFADLSKAENGVLASMLEGLEAVEHDHNLSEENEHDDTEQQEDENKRNDFDVPLGNDDDDDEDGKTRKLGPKMNYSVPPSRLQNEEPNADKVDEAQPHKLVQEEKGEKGAVSNSIIREYLKAMGTRRVPFSFIFAIIAYALMAASDLYLANWIRNSETIGEDQSQHLKHAAIYITLAILHVLGVENLSLHNTRSSVYASKNVHAACMDRLLKAKLEFFNETPSGRIISRFSGDLSMIDRQLAFIFDDVFQFFFLLTALCVVVCVIVPELAAVILVGLGLFAFQVVAVDRSNREVKRYANQRLAPILTNVSETVGARDLIRCMKLQDFFCRRHYEHVDRYTSNVYFSYTLVNFSTLISGVISFLLSTGAAITVVFRRETYDPALVGLALTYSFLAPYFLSILSIVLPIGFAALTSLERVVEYKSEAIPIEAPWHMPIDDELENQQDAAASFVVVEKDHQEPSWPTHGCVEFVDATLIYRAGLPPALKNINVKFEGGMKASIVGRTGSGKSSLTMLLFRIYEAAGGQVLIDGQDISKIGLQLLRRSLCIIPQQPLLLRGSTRKNLDPFDNYTDRELVAVMNKVGLNTGLLKDGDISCAQALSAGERQLLSLARALLRTSLKICVLDEPSSNLDQQSDDQIQKVMRSEFTECTVITIAHRLGSVIDSDKILVMDAGQVSEYDHPHLLLQKPNGQFAKMVNSMGDATATMLKEKAKASYQSKPNQTNT